MPVVPVGGKLVEVSVPGEHRGGRLRAPSRQARKPVGGIADEREIIRDGLRRHAELRLNARFVANLPRAPIELHDSRPADRCARSLSGVQMHDLLDPLDRAAATRAAAASASSASNSTIGQTMTPTAASASSSSGNCAPELRLDSVAGLVAGPEIVAERFDDVIGRDADMRRAAR